MLCVYVAKVTAPDVYAILPPQSGDRQPENVSRWLLEGLLAYMVSEVQSCAVSISYWNSTLLTWVFYMNKTKVMISGERQMVRQKDVKWLCGVCSKGVGSNSIQCSSCQKWVHKKCSGIKGSMSKVANSFICRDCLNPVISAGRTSVDIGASAKL